MQQATIGFLKACVMADRSPSPSHHNNMSTTEPPKESDGTGPPGTADEPISAADQAAIDAAMAEETGPAAKSLKCVDCGKLFKNADLANYHAEKSGHENFEESVEEVFPILAK